ncbi:MAG: hypothetical protein ACYCXU_00655 [Thermoleophilia bacterium]
MREKLVAALAAVLVITTLAIASGCGAATAGQPAELSADKYNQINVGMTSDQVKSIAGDPARTESKDTGSMPGMHMNGSQMDYWYYQGSRGWVRIEVSEGKVTAKSGY